MSAKRSLYISQSDATGIICQAARDALKEKTIPVGIDESTGIWPDENEEVSNTLALDSIDFLELILHLEEKYDLIIPEEKIDVYEIQTIGDLAALAVACESSRDGG